MKIVIDKSSKIPAYQQIFEQIKAMVVDGLLPAGEKMPSMRELSQTLGLSLSTVQTAYEELEAVNVIEIRHGSGTFVSSLPKVSSGENLRTRDEMHNPLADLPEMLWEPYYFPHENFIHSVPPNAEEMIRFTQATPDPSLFPFKRIKQIATSMLWSPKEFFFDRGHPQGYLPLIEHLEKEMALAGIPMAEGENDIILTGGFQRALSLVLRLILNPGQKVAIESPSYSGIINFLVSERIEAEPIPVDEQGMDTEYLATVLNRGEVRAVITMPTFHNPTGVSMSHSRKEHLIQLAAKHRIPIIEDDWARHLRYRGELPSTLKSMDPGGYVIHIGTYSKCFLPGLRIGWITCPAKLSEQLICAKMGSDNGDSWFLQVLLMEIIAKGYFKKHLRKSVKEYKKRCSAMVKCLKAHLPEGCSFFRPDGGFSVWLNLPEGITSLPLQSLARQRGIDFLPATFCNPGRTDSNALRLSFSKVTEEDITKGIKILCELIQTVKDKPGMLEPGNPEGNLD